MIWIRLNNRFLPAFNHLQHSGCLTCQMVISGMKWAFKLLFRLGLELLQSRSKVQKNILFPATLRCFAWRKKKHKNSSIKISLVRQKLLRIRRGMFFPKVWILVLCIYLCSELTIVLWVVIYVCYCFCFACLMLGGSGVSDIAANNKANFIKPKLCGAEAEWWMQAECWPLIYTRI